MKPGLRITGGLYRGRRVAVPPGEIRPAMDRMRESMFAILGDLSGLSFLDLFAGSGVMAIEACSRGAIRAVSVERDRRKRSVLEQNLSIADGAAELVMTPVEAFLRRNAERFDLVYLDPPFKYQRKCALLELVGTSGCTDDDGLVILHHPGEELPKRVGSLVHANRKRYGGSTLEFYRLINDR